MADTKMTLRPSPDLKARLHEAAQRDHRSDHAQVLVYIERGLEADAAKSSTEEERQ